MMAPSSVIRLGTTMHWLFGLISLVAFVGAFLSHSAGWMALGLLVGVLAAIAAVFALAGARIDAGSRQEQISDTELELLRASMRPQRDGNRGAQPPS